MSSSNKNTDIYSHERALGLQGGGSLGAYEAGAYKAVNEWLFHGGGMANVVEQYKREGKDTGITFDIIAGTSIGAMN